MIPIFQYIPTLDAFVVDPTFRRISEELGLTEWHEVVWIGRYFTLDNDYGEHWFDNWELRDQREAKAQALGIAYEEMLVIDPDRFQNGKDGPCHTPDQRKQFWTEVLISLQLSIDFIAVEARQANDKRKQWNDDDYIQDLDERIEKIKRNL